MVSRGFVAPERIVWIGQGIDTKRFQPALTRAAAEERIGLGPSRFRIVAVGRIVEGKGFSDLLTAVAKMRHEGYQAEMILVGGNIAHEISPLARELIEEAHALGVADAVTITGMVENVEDYLAASDVFVIPSYREGLSRALLEAMSMGLPVIATSIRGNREVIQDSVNGLLFSPREVSQLTAHLRLLYDQPGLRSLLGQQARTVVLERFDERDFVARQVVEVERLLSQCGVPALSETSQPTHSNITVALKRAHQV